ncbi:MAG: C40 family peptidase [Christensenellales bacterium]|jgi:hypothetical protein
MDRVIIKNEKPTTQKRVKNKAPRLAFIALFLILIAALGYVIWDSIPSTPYEALSIQEVENIISANPPLDDKRQEVLDSGLSLLGKVNYFWGGKSNSIGWDKRWGVPMIVMSKGSETTGTQRPFGLDCSGFVTWCFMQAGYTPEQADELIGNGTWNQWDRSVPIKWKDISVGDYAFENEYPTNKGNHIGICVGFDDKNQPVFMHCAYSFNNVVVTNAGHVFKYPRRPNVFISDN